jgi:hypothetical protein
MAAGSTYTPLATNTLGSNASDITFSSISGSYTDLVLIVNGYLTVDDNVFLQFNGDTGSNYSMTSLRGDGTSATSAKNSNVSQMYLGGILTTATGNIICSIQNYSNSTTNKTVIARVNGVTSGATQARAGLWRSTSAITSVKVGALSGAFVSGTSFTLYGIAAA